MNRSGKGARVHAVVAFNDATPVESLDDPVFRLPKKFSVSA
jgi:hypothetical protein